jgi:hypothetical protein
VNLEWTTGEEHGYGGSIKWALFNRTPNASCPFKVLIRTEDYGIDYEVWREENIGWVEVKPPRGLNFDELKAWLTAAYRMQAFE